MISAPRTWLLWAGRYTPEPKEGREFKTVGEHDRFVRAYGHREAVRVLATEDLDGLYWGWIDRDRTVPTMIQPHYALFRIQFPYDVSATAAHEGAEVVRMTITALPDS